MSRILIYSRILDEDNPLIRYAQCADVYRDPIVRVIVSSQFSRKKKDKNHP